MRKMSSQEIRETWIRFFKAKGHSVEPSASLVPHDDPTLLWINAGVAPLKKYFDGRERPMCPRITNVQKCIRTNDIENVGKTARHHTFFEMMGNFSIGDYFKDEVIPFAFELLTSEEYFGIPKELLYMTVYSQDEKAIALWKSLGVEDSHIIPMDSNFWEIGEGPSGPDTEIFFDRGEEYDSRGPIVIKEDLESDRFIEIWNIVFSQYNAEPGKKKREEYDELPSKNIDTGAGLERFACVLQGVDSNYDTDLFVPIIQKIEEISGVKYTGQMAFKVIADHVRTVTFALSDGAIFANEGRGYVLRRVLRRACKYAKSLGINRPFMASLVDVVLEIMGKFYPYLNDNIKLVKDMITKEETKFLQTITNGEARLADMIKKCGETLSGEDAFQLYDTYGFPIELTVEYANELGANVDLDGFKNAMDEQKKRAREARKTLNSMGSQNEEYLNFNEASEFIGYDTLESKAKVIAVFENALVLDKTPFYAFSGGQVCDKGTIDGYDVVDVIKMPNGQHLHFLDDMPFNVGEVVTCKVDEENRNKTRCNHSSAHLLQKALQTHLGNHVHQHGSQVTSEYCRFDFNNFNNLTDEDLLTIEKLVNDHISKNTEVITHVVSIEEAKAMGAMALFGEKYGSVVRVVDMDWSKELCGGTHVANTGDIKHFAICSCESIGSGIYRILASTGDNYMEVLKENLHNIMTDLNAVLDKTNALLADYKAKGFTSKVIMQTNYDLNALGYQYIIELRKYVACAKDYLKNLTKEYSELNSKNAISDLSSFDEFIEGDSLVAVVNDYENGVLKQIADALLNKMGKGVVFLANVSGGKIVFVCKQNSTYNAGSLVKLAAVITGGNGGGKPDIAQAGGKDISKLEEAIAAVKKEVSHA